MQSPVNLVLICYYPGIVTALGVGEEEKDLGQIKHGADVETNRNNYKWRN